jgi:hypothetical protein
LAVLAKRRDMTISYGFRPRRQLRITFLQETHEPMKVSAEESSRAATWSYLRTSLPGNVYDQRWGGIQIGSCSGDAGGETDRHAWQGVGETEQRQPCLCSHDGKKHLCLPRRGQERVYPTQNSDARPSFQSSHTQVINPFLR